MSDQDKNRAMEENKRRFEQEMARRQQLLGNYLNQSSGTRFQNIYAQSNTGSALSQHTSSAQSRPIPIPGSSRQQQHSEPFTNTLSALSQHISSARSRPIPIPGSSRQQQYTEPFAHTRSALSQHISSARSEPISIPGSSRHGIGQSSTSTSPPSSPEFQQFGEPEIDQSFGRQRRRHPAGDQRATDDLSRRFSSGLSIGSQMGASGSTSPPSSPQFQQFGEPEIDQSFGRQRRRHPAGDQRATDDLSRRFSSDLSIGSQMGASGSGTSGQQQTEPSVRPKVRQSLPDEFLPFSERTSPPDVPQAEAQTGPSVRPKDRTKSLKIGLAASNLARFTSQEVGQHDRRRHIRQRAKLIDRGYRFQNDPETGQPRFHPQQNMAGLPNRRPRLIPATARDRDNLTAARFNKPTNEQDWRMKSTIGPVGRQNFGPLRRRQLSVPDLNATIREHLPTNMDLFRQSYSALPEDEKHAYQQYRRQITWPNNKEAKGRMVKKPTIGALREVNINKIREMKYERSKFSQNRLHSLEEANRNRAQRRQYIKDRARYPSSIRGKTFDVTQTISEEDEDQLQDQEENETEEEDQ